jgi:hypothetical protein
VRSIAGGAHDGDDLFDLGRIRRVAQPLVAGNLAGVESGQRRRRSTSTARSSGSSDMTPPRVRGRSRLSGQIHARPTRLGRRPIASDPEQRSNRSLTAIAGASLRQRRCSRSLRSGARTRRRRAYAPDVLVGLSGASAARRGQASPAWQRRRSLLQAKEKAWCDVAHDRPQAARPWRLDPKIGEASTALDSGRRITRGPSMQTAGVPRFDPSDHEKVAMMFANSRFNDWY